MSDRYKNYVSVAERLNEAVPDIASIITDAPVMLTDAMGYIRATVALRDGAAATGTASFRLDLQGKSAQATNPLEDCETSAVGRALGFLGYSSNRSIATREEVLEAQRRAEASYEPPRAPAAPQKPAQAATNGAEAADARRKFYEQWGAVAGTTWAAVQGFIGKPFPEPTTVEGWREVWRMTKDTAAAAAVQAEYDQIEKAAA